MNRANGMSEIEGKATRVGASEWSRGDPSDIDGKTERSKWVGAHMSTRVVSEFSFKNRNRETEKRIRNPGRQERKQSLLLLTFFTAGLQNSGEFGKTADHYL
jgi:hypothetical protein